MTHPRRRVDSANDPAAVELGHEGPLRPARPGASASGSTRAPATPAPTPARCGRHRHPTGDGDVQRRDSDRLADVDVRHTGDGHAEHDLRRLLLRAQRPLLRRRRLLRGGADYQSLHALADGVDGGNGVYRYGTGGGFPTSTFNGGQLLGRRDLPDPGQRGRDTADTSPRRPPRAGATGVPLTTAVSATFSEPVTLTGVAVHRGRPGRRQAGGRDRRCRRTRRR